VSGALSVAFCPPSLRLAGARIVALAWCSRELSTYCMAATSRMPWLAVVKAGTCCPPAPSPWPDLPPTLTHVGAHRPAWLP
jgi:hypothetical protein